MSPGFDRRAFSLFDAWRDLRSSARDPYTDAREAIARGLEIFNTRTFTIENVVNDTLGIAALPGTCTTCHNTPNVGNHSTSLPLNLGLTSAAVRTPDLPLHTFRTRTTGEVFQTTDPGRALITGKWKDMALFKGPILRGLAARGPYFHNGFAAMLLDVVEFYNLRFNIGLSAQKKAELVAFLKALGGSSAHLLRSSVHHRAFVGNAAEPSLSRFLISGATITPEVGGSSPILIATNGGTSSLT